MKRTNGIISLRSRQLRWRDKWWKKSGNRAILLLLFFDLSMPKKEKLEIKGLYVAADNREIVKGFDLTIKTGELHIIMGPNGSGKSTLLNAIMGHPGLKVTKGKVLLNGEDVLKLGVDKRAQKGLFLAFQYPREIPGVLFGNFVRLAKNNLIKANKEKERPYGPLEFYEVMQQNLEEMKMDRAFIGRSLNEGFSGGEKKRAEILQMGILKPKFAMLDEIDSGLDVDALKVAAGGIKKFFDEGKSALLIITHYERILKFLKPDYVHIMADGRLVKSGGSELYKQVEKHGYEKFIKGL